mmetsp:Transcript_11321/g.26831  ORF Transcript_11321/g.26831 Transcript_11321/m.26831 type:complete len:1216 (+) Transcript_11321:1-3648(+)
MRTFRLLRVFKLARSWKELNKIINTIFRSLSSIAYLSLILLLIIFIFALLGMQLFGYKYSYCSQYADSFKLCPENVSESDISDKCPNHFSCYIECDRSEKETWINVADKIDGGTSEYFNTAFCEEKVFTWDSLHNPDGHDPVQDHQNNTYYVAKVGESYVARHNFDNVFVSFITIFQLLTGENWNPVMYDGMRSAGTFAVSYFVFLLIVGNYVLLNLFLAILLDNFSSSPDLDSSKGSVDGSVRIAADGECEQAQPLAPGADVEEGPASSRPGGEQTDDPANIIKAVTTNRSLRARNSGGTGNSGMPRVNELTERSLFVFAKDNPVRVFLNRIVSHRYFEYTIIALILFSSICLALDSAELADRVRFGGNSSAATLDKALTVLDKVFVALFVLEAVLKIIVMGFVLHPGAYLRNPWNVLDFFIVIVGLVLVAAESTSLSAGNIDSLRALRTFRALRPIRMASRAEGMKTVVNSLFQAIPPLGNVVLVCLLFFLIFSILFVNLLKGSFYSCQVVCPVLDLDVGLGPDYCEEDSWLATFAGMRLDPRYITGGGGSRSINREWCQARSNETKSGVGFHLITDDPDADPDWFIVSSRHHDEINETFPVSLINNSEKALPAREHKEREYPVLYHEWVNKDANFDNVLNSLITLFEMATLEMWPDIMYDAVDATGIDKQPIRDSQLWICVVVVLFLVVCAFFVLNLFVGVTIDKFNDMKAKQEGRSLFLTEEQQNWLTIQKLLAACRPIRRFKPPEGGARRSVYDVVSSDWFDGFIMSMIMINVLFMSMEHYGMDDAWVEVTTNANYFFTALFALEAALKIVSHGVVGYFRDAWNIFDFTVVNVSIVGIILENTLNNTNVSVVSLLRVFRVARIFRLIPKAKGLRTLFQTLVFSLPALINVGSVLLLFFFIFSVMGMNLFGGVREGEFINRHANFDTFPRSMLTLMRMATGESWNGIMHDVTVSEDCVLLLENVTLSSSSWEFEKGDYISPRDAEYNCASCYEDLTGDLQVGRDALPRDVYNEHFKDMCGQHKAVAVAYFFCFVLMCSFILLNLVIAVILDNFQSSSANEAMPVTRFHMSRFVEAWSDLDPQANCFIPVSKLSNLISELEPPLGVKGVVHTKSEVQNIIMTVDIPNRGGNVHFLETLHALSGRVAGTRLPEEEEEHIHGKMLERLPDSDFPKYSAAHYHAALYVQAAVRGFLARHQMKNRMQPAQGEGEGG